MLLKSEITQVRRVQYPELDTVRCDWVLHFERQVPMGGNLSKEKVAIIVKTLYPLDEVGLRFSSGWLERWKLRHGIKEDKKHQKSGDEDLRVVNNNLPQLRNILGVFLRDDMYIWMRLRSFMNFYQTVL